MYKVNNGIDPLVSINTTFTGYQKTVTTLQSLSGGAGSIFYVAANNFFV